MGGGMEGGRNEGKGEGCVAARPCSGKYCPPRQTPEAVRCDGTDLHFKNSQVIKIRAWFSGRVVHVLASQGSQLNCSLVDWLVEWTDR